MQALESVKDGEVPGEEVAAARAALAHELSAEHRALSLIKKALSDLKCNQQTMLRCAHQDQAEVGDAFALPRCKYATFAQNEKGCSRCDRRPLAGL